MATHRGYTLQRATLRDVWKIRQLEKIVFPKDAYPVLEIIMLILAPISRNYKMVAPNGDMAGFISGTVGTAGRPGWIITLGVNPQHQRQGLGRFLLDWCERELQAEHIRLTVRAGNMAAYTLYAETGYTDVRRRRSYYRDGEDGIEMEKALNPPSIPPSSHLPRVS
ncbi:MAG: GNAT family N-acetyltransferase [Chloroflexi bacterium]|nr:GNAT family N-acetyltransferase [Chloroflexota bacterium]